MKILIVSGSFSPPRHVPRGIRTSELVKEFSKRGDEVKLYIPEFDYDFTSFIKQYNNVSVNSLNVRLTSLRRPNFFLLNYLFALIRGGLNFFFAYPDIKLYFAIPKVLKQESGYDLLISLANPHSVHWGVARLFKKNPAVATTWVADCGDPYMLISKLNYKGIRLNTMFYFKGLEKSFCRRANYIAVPAEASKGGYYPEFQDKIKVIPQGFDFEKVILKEYVPNKIVTFAFSGMFYKHFRNPRPILDFLIDLGMDFRFVVYNEQTFLEDYKQVLKEKLILRNNVDRLLLLNELSSMDFLLNIVNSGIQTQIPSKLIDYALTRRPVLSIDHNQIDKENFIRFLNRDYSGASVIENLNSYDIKNVVTAFRQLATKEDN